jgi:hypothetical protein
MNKRGQGEAMTLFTAFEILVVVIVFGILAFVGTNFDYISQATEIYAEKDLSYMASTLESSPGKVTYNYPVKKIYTVEVQTSNINVLRTNTKFSNFYEYYNLSLVGEQGSFKVT